jgi:6-phosphogluconolactonase
MNQVKTPKTDRRTFVKSCAMLGAAAGMLGPAGLRTAFAASSSGKTFVYVGSWGHMGGADGIAAYEFNTHTGELKLIEQIDKSIRVGATCIDEGRGLYYVTDERSNHPDFGNKGGGGSIVVYSVDKASGRMKEFSRQYSYGPQPSYIAIDKTKSYLLCTLYGGGDPVTLTERQSDGSFRIVTKRNETATLLFRLNQDGSVGKLLDMYEHVNNMKEERARKKFLPNPHCVMMSPDGNLFATCDKGCSAITFFHIDRAKDKLVVASEPYQQEPGTGARYCLYHPAKPYLYVNNEKKAEVCTFSYDRDGNLKLVQTISPLDDDSLLRKIPAGGKFEQQDFRIHPNGKYIYALSRGAKDKDSAFEAVTVFEIDDASGRLKRKQVYFIDGLWPRGAAISPDGKWLLAACILSNEVLVMSIAEDGRISTTGRIHHETAGQITFFQA